MRPWDHWYHCTAHAYGRWLRGDARGWRARNHREHVDGDYKKPPPRGKYDALLAYSKSLMKRDPVRIERELRQFILDQVIQRLLERDNEVDIGSLDGIHLHVLARCYKNNPRIELGSAKQFATAQLKAHGFAVGLNLKVGEGLWSRGSHPTPIADERHFRRVRKYIYDHIKKGAIIWKPRSFAEISEVDLLI